MIIDQVSLKNKILADRYNRIVFAAGSGDVYIVGGYLRDLLIGRRSLDRDFAVREPSEEIILKIATATGGKIVRLGRKELVRIILRTGLTLDFSPLRQNIEHDLSKRDFTINAMAWSPESGLIDLYGGIGDVSRGIVRMVSEDNIRNDAVRVLRAYRFCAELSFMLGTETREALRKHANMIAAVKSERTTLEFFKILNLKDPITILKKMKRAGVLSSIISINNSELGLRLKELYKLQAIIEKLPLKYRKKITRNFSQNLTFGGLLRLDILLMGAPQHRLSLSSATRRHLQLTRQGTVFLRSRRSISSEETFELFKMTKEAALEVLVTQAQAQFIPEYERYVRLSKWALPLEEIMETSGLCGGRELGILIDSVRKARFSGLVKTKRDVMRFICESCLGSASRKDNAQRRAKMDARYEPYSFIIKGFKVIF